MMKPYTSDFLGCDYIGFVGAGVFALVAVLLCVFRKRGKGWLWRRMHLRPIEVASFLGGAAAWVLASTLITAHMSRGRSFNRLADLMLAGLVAIFAWMGALGVIGGYRRWRDPAEYGPQPPAAGGVDRF